MKHKSLYAFVVILLLWSFLHSFIDGRIIPSPVETIEVVVTIFVPVLLPHTIASLYRVLVAVGVTLCIGVPIGLYLGGHPKVDQLVSPVIFTLYPVPKIAFLPILMLFFGLGNTSKIILVGLIIVFQIIISTRDSVRTIEKELYYSIESLGASKGQVYRHMILPAVLPNLLTALRISIGTSLSVLFFAENYATKRGLGFFIMDSWLKISYVEMFAGIVMMSLLGILLFKVIDFTEKRYCSWVFISSKGI